MQRHRLSQPEFVTMLAILFATIAFSIDAMLPALPQIVAELTPDDPNRVQLILTSFVFGMGLGTFIAGPISDAVGRKIAITVGVAIYLVGSVLAYFSTSLEFLCAARVLQGLGASAPRIIALAMIRDQYEGREMARITSFVMMIFMLVPAAAPALGAVIIAFSDWRGIFGAFIVFALIGVTWMNLRQPETLLPERRRPLRAGTLALGLKEVFGNRRVMIYTAVMTLGFGQMFAMLTSTQQIYDQIFGMADSFPMWFAVTALLAGTSTFLNASLVMRLGMRRLAVSAYAMQIAVSVVVLALTLTDVLPAALGFPVFLFWSISVFFMAGLTFGNLNALALEPMGHIAGLAASMIGAISTVLAVAVATPIGLAFNGTAVPLMFGTLVCSTLAWLLMRWAGVPQEDSGAQPAE